MTAAADAASPDQPLDVPPEPADNDATASVLATSEAGANVPPPAATSAHGAPVDWLLVAWITVLAACTAVVGIAFLPLYVGSIPFPISALLGVAAMILAPRACYRLTRSLIAALLPVAAWFGVTVALVLARNSLIGATDSAGALVGLPISVGTGQWRVMVLLGLGSLAAAATVGLIWGDRLRDRLAAERAAAQARDDAAEQAAEAELG